MHITLADGRTLDVHDSTNGVHAPLTVVWHHGSPQTGAALEPHLKAAALRGIRWISYARPSYGDSSAQPGRTVTNAAADVEQLINAMGIDQIAVMGASGGGPHALACAAIPDHRVWAVATLASLAPFSTEFNWFAGMAGGGPSLRAAQHGKDARVTFERTSDFDEDSFNSRDYAALKSEWTSLNADAGAATAAGPEGLIADDLAFVTPWGVDLSSVRIPVLLAHGGDDRVVPPSHSQWLLEHLSDAELWTRPRDGHVSILNASAVAMDWLRQQAKMDSDALLRPPAHARD